MGLPDIIYLHISLAHLWVNFRFFIIFSNNWIISVIENSQSTPELKLALLVVCGGGSGGWWGELTHIWENHFNALNMTADRWSDLHPPPLTLLLMNICCCCWSTKWRRWCCAGRTGHPPPPTSLAARNLLLSNSRRLTSDEQPPRPSSILAQLP